MHPIAAPKSAAPAPAALRAAPSGGAGAPAVSAETSRYAARYLERAALLARLRTVPRGEVAPQPEVATRVDTATVVAALAPVLLPGATGGFAATPAAGAAVRRVLTPLPGGRMLAVDVAAATLRFDAADLARVLLELADNACRHAAAGSTVRVRGAVGTNGYQLSVTNTGEPLPRRVLAMLRSGGTGAVAGGPGGLALGVSIASLLATLNGARLEVLRGAGRPNTLRVIVPRG